MVKIPHAAPFLLITAAFLSAGTILLDDSTRVTAAIVDTGGGYVTVRHDGHCLRIDKKQVLKVDAGDDSLYSNPGKYGDTGSAAILYVNDALVSTLASYPVKETAIALNGGIAFQKQPLVATGGVDKKAIGAFSDRMARFLAKHGSVRTVSKEGAFFRLLGDAVSDCPYLAMPAEISVRSNDRKMSVSSFAKLDKSGNFIPAKTGTTLQARETEAIVRFVIIDLPGKTVVFDERVKHSDPGLQSLVPESSKDPQIISGNNSILTIESKFEALLKKRFK